MLIVALPIFLGCHASPLPAKAESKTRRLAAYFYWCIYGIFGPELVIWTAWRQLLSAWALRNELRKEKVSAFTYSSVNFF